MKTIKVQHIETKPIIKYVILFVVAFMLLYVLLIAMFASFNVPINSNISTTQNSQVSSPFFDIAQLSVFILPFVISSALLILLIMLFLAFIKISFKKRGGLTVRFTEEQKSEKRNNGA